jgi:uncharacterized protein DUF6886
MSPRPSPPGTPHEGRMLVWAVDGAHLPNYLLPRACPRVCWSAAPTSPGILASPAPRVIAIEYQWLPKLQNAGLQVHDLEPDGFTCLDATAGYWVAEHDVRVRAVQQVDDCVVALAQCNVEVRLTTSLWPYVDAVVAERGEFSVIRIRNAAPKQS